VGEEGAPTLRLRMTLLLADYALPSLSSRISKRVPSSPLGNRLDLSRPRRRGRCLTRHNHEARGGHDLPWGALPLVEAGMDDLSSDLEEEENRLYANHVGNSADGQDELAPEA
jgi:hypothetical protein